MGTELWRVRCCVPERTVSAWWLGPLGAGVRRGGFSQMKPVPCGQCPLLL